MTETEKLTPEQEQAIEAELRAQHIQGFLPTEDDEQEMRLRLRSLVRDVVGQAERDQKGGTR